MREIKHGDDHSWREYTGKNKQSGIYNKTRINWKGGYVLRGYNEKREHTHGTDKLRRRLRTEVTT